MGWEERKEGRTLLIVCAVCRKLIDVIEPEEDRRVSHGYCKKCFAEELAKLETKK